MLCIRRSEGLSGRTLRKIPFLAHALFTKVSSLLQQNLEADVDDNVILQSDVVTLEVYLDTLEKAVQKQFAERKGLGD